MGKLYVVRFYYADSNGYDEFCYWSRESAEGHKALLVDDDMYSKIEIFEETTHLYDNV